MTRNANEAAAMPAGLTMWLVFAAAAIALGLLAVPRAGHAQGIVRGAQEGTYEGNRIAGPVGGVVGGAVGAGVGGAVGAIHGVLGIPYGHHYRCRGFYDRYPLERVVDLWREAGIVDVRARRLSLGGGVVVWGRRAR